MLSRKRYKTDSTEITEILDKKQTLRPALLFCLAIFFLTSCSSFIQVKTSSAADAATRWQENNHAGLEYLEQQDYPRAEKLFKTALKDAENLKEKDLKTGATLNNLASVYEHQHKYRLAEKTSLQALKRFQDAVGFAHPTVNITMSNLANIYKKEKKYPEAIQSYKEALRYQETAPDPQWDKIADNLHGLAEAYEAQGKLLLAEPIFERVVKTRLRARKQDDPQVISDLNDYSRLLHSLGKIREARAIDAVVNRINLEKASEAQENGDEEQPVQQKKDANSQL